MVVVIPYFARYADSWDATFLGLRHLPRELTAFEVEVFFQYAGFGRMLFDAANFGDIQVLQAATLVAVCVAVSSQLLSDAAYVFLNPRVRFA